MSIYMYIYVYMYTNDTGISNRHLILKNQISSDKKKILLEEKILSDIKYVTDDLKVSMTRLWYVFVCVCTYICVMHVYMCM
jgi:hypothetical protein